jgi:glycerol-1-phosphatase
VLKECDVALWQAYDVAMLDLDGVVYVGSAAVPGAPEQLAKATDAGMRLAYVTNNASRPPATVADHLVRLGIPVSAEDVVTSAQAASRLLADQLPSGSPVFVIGGTGLFDALTERGLEGVQDIGREPVAVVSGYHPDLRWKTVIDGAILVKRGLPWVATNTDLTVPTDQGQGPGNGVLVKVVADFAGREPVVAGKPAPPLFEETRDRVGGRCPLVVGDRLDTDIEGAVNAGVDSLLVMTGVTGLNELVRAKPGARPKYVAAGLEGLGTSHEVPQTRDGACRLNGWSATVEDGVLGVHGEGTRDDWWRVVATAAWTYLDATSGPVGVSGLRPPEGADR